MPLCRIADTMLYFAHIPKTGGSSVEAYMEAKGSVALRHNRLAGDWSRTTPQHIPAAVFSAYIPDDFYDCGFAILRDPKAKMISTFRMRVSDRHVWTNPLNWLLWLWAKAHGRKVFAIRVWRFRLTLDFDTWMWIVSHWMRRSPYIYDGHCLPQSAYMHPGQELFLFEDGLEPVFRWIDTVSGTPALPGSFHEKKAKGAAVTCSPATEARLRTVYAEDYALIARLRADLEAARTAPAADAGAPPPGEAAP